MNTKQIQLNRQWMIALLLAGLVLALAAGLAWAGTEAGGSAFSLQPGYTEQSAAGEVCPGAEGSKLGSGTDGFNSRDCASEVLRGSSPSFTAGSKPGVGVGSGGGIIKNKPPTDGDSFMGSASGALPGSLPGLMAGGKGGIFGDC